MMDYESFRFGSADWATTADMQRAGLFKPGGPLLGFDGQRALYLDSDAPMVTFGGAGTGKLRDLLAYSACGYRADDGKLYSPMRVFINDPRAELTAISIQNQVRYGKAAYCINPRRLHSLPSQRVNPWDMLRPDSPTLRADLKLLVADLIALSGSAQAEYFELRAREWAEFLVLWYVYKTGGITMSALYDIINTVVNESDWLAIGEDMADSPHADIRRAAADIHWKRQNAEKEFSAILGEILKSISFLSDPAIYDMLSGADFSLDVLCKEDCNVYLSVPAEYLDQLAPMTRALVGAAMLYKYRYPQAPRILFMIDEAATLGRFESLLRGYSYGRGMGCRMWSCWQGVDQIARNFGKEAVQTIVGSSQVRQFLGVRDLETASMVSAMLGAQTLEYDDELAQKRAKTQRKRMIRDLLMGGDPVQIGTELVRENHAASHRTKQPRLLMARDEVLNMPEDRQILFISGLNLYPIQASKYPYFTRPEMAGHYLPNPYHPPTDRVRIGSRSGSHWARVITERVPEKYADLPQYQSGEWSFIEGYRPK